MEIQEGEIYQSNVMNAEGIPATVFHSRRIPEGGLVLVDIIVIRPAPPPHVIVSPDNEPTITISVSGRPSVFRVVPDRCPSQDAGSFEGT